MNPNDNRRNDNPYSGGGGNRNNFQAFQGQGYSLNG